MGSWISRVSDSPPTPKPTLLPLDIYLLVLSNLNSLAPDDRETLCQLSLCCRTLRDMSQKILFRGLRPELLGRRTGDLDRLMDIHDRFLYVVANSPDRLAKFVVHYSQDRLGIHPNLIFAAKKERVHRWKRRLLTGRLTEQALPVMVNLKHLRIVPRIADPFMLMVLQRCTFQLESFTWIAEGCQEALISNFLPTQRGLLHLVIYSGPEGFGQAATPVLPDGLCPSLTSVRCPLSDLVSISAERHITALDTTARDDLPLNVDQMEEAERGRYIAAVKKIRYLRLSTLPIFQKSTIGITFHRLTMLDISGWLGTQEVRWRYAPLILAPSYSHTLKQFLSTGVTQFPELQSLRVRDRVLNGDADRMATRAFEQCPKLEEVLVLEEKFDGITVEAFWRSSGSELERYIFSMENSVASPWWKVQLYEWS